MNLLDQVRWGLRILGLRGIWQAVRYSVARDRLNRRFRTPEPTGGWTAPGPVQSVAELGSGARWHFAATTLEVTFLAGDLVRYEWAGGEVPLPYALGRDTWPPATTHLHKVADGWRLEADGLAVLVSSDGSLCFYDAEGRLLRREHPPERRGTSWVHRAGLLSGERIYGLGERAASFDLRGRTYRLWNLDPGGAYDRGTDPVYLCIPVYLGLHPLGSYLYFCENPFDETTDAGTSGRRRLH